MADSHPNPVDHPTHRLVGNAPAMAALRAQIRHLAPFDTLGSPAVPTLLLQGETGTGKGLVARVIHDSGPRAAGPFIEVNCAAIPESMLEAELFGFEAGAFTDAKRAKPGLFEAAVGGTLLLDEVDALPLALQGKLLTAIETKRVRRLGAVAERVVDVKLIAATNAVLEQRIATGHFRADLYHRLAVVVLALPPLRERGEDVLLLAGRLLQQYTAAHGVPPKRLSAEAEAWLQHYTWPGNVRELIHVMERVTLLHIGEEVDAGTLTQLGHPLTASMADAEVSISTAGGRADEFDARGGGADSPGAGPNGGQCGTSGAAVGTESGYGALSHAALWHCTYRPQYPAPACIPTCTGRQRAGLSSSAARVATAGSPRHFYISQEEKGRGVARASSGRARRGDRQGPPRHDTCLGAEADRRPGT